MPEDFSILSDIQKKVDDVISSMGGYWEPLAMLAALLEEIGELSREITHNLGIKPKKLQGLEKSEISPPIKQKSIFENSLSEELGDTLFALICLANYYKIDLNHTMEKIFTKYRTRDKNRFNSTKKS